MGETGFSVPAVIGSRRWNLTEVKTLAKEMRESYKNRKNGKQNFRVRDLR
jgi:hypothetical protein